MDDSSKVLTPLQEEILRGLPGDALEDIIANKLCALLGRSDVKDLVDLYFVAASGIDPLQYLQEAKLKDGAMEPATLAFVLEKTPLDFESLLLLKPVSRDDLRCFRDDLVRRLVEMAWPDSHSG